MNAKFTLAIIALVGIGVFALPSTMSLFAGQHSFYNIDATGNQVPCVKCHGDVKAELGSNANTNPANGPLTAGPHAAFKCEYCHRIEQGASSGDNAVAIVPYENATGAIIRAIAIPVSDMEAGNFPTNITGAELFVAAPGSSASSRNMIGGTKLQFGNGAVSAATADALLAVAPRQDWTISPTYSTTTGLPLDTNVSTMNGGLEPSKINVTINSARPYVTLGFLNAGSQAVNPGSKYHAASLVSCMECHGGEEPLGHYTRVTSGTRCSDCHYGYNPVPGARWTQLAAGGFGLTTSANDTGTSEAHNAWVKTDDGVNRFGGEQGREANNGACIGCHTHVAVDISFNKGYKLAFTATETAEGVYSVSNTAVEGIVHVDIYGNGSGATFGVGDKSYTWTPDKTLYLNGNGSVITGLDGESSDSAAALTN